MSDRESPILLLQPTRWSGFWNLFRKESADWWATPTWAVQSLLWFGLVNVSMLVVLLFSLDMPPEARLHNGIGVFATFLGLFGPIGAVIKVQDAFVGERLSGTMEWILSKPISRISYVLAKFLSNALGLLATMIVLPSIVAYVEIWVFSQTDLAIGRFIVGSSLLGLNALFFMSLTLMMGVVSSSRGVIVGIPLALALAQQLILNLVPWMARVTPWNLFRLVEPYVVGAQGQGLGLVAGSSVVWLALFVAVAVWRFQSEEMKG